MQLQIVYAKLLLCVACKLPKPDAAAIFRFSRRSCDMSYLASRICETGERIIPTRRFPFVIDRLATACSNHRRCSKENQFPKQSLYLPKLKAAIEKNEITQTIRDTLLQGLMVDSRGSIVEGKRTSRTIHKGVKKTKKQMKIAVRYAIWPTRAPRFIIFFFFFFT